MTPEKNSEVSIRNASLIRNVWEIRTKAYSQKLNSEQERVKNSALERINHEWKQRMTSPRKPPPLLQQRVNNANTEEDLNNYASNPSLPYTSKTIEFSKPTVHKKGRSLSKRGKNIIDIFERQPSLLVWAKSWKFSRPVEDEQAESVSDWGKSWKFLNLQPGLEGQSWSEQDSSNDDLDFLQHNSATLLPKEAKSNAIWSSQDLEENLWFSEWGDSWKFSKNLRHVEESLFEDEQSNECIDNPNDKDLRFSYRNMHLNEDKMSDWGDSWRVSKPEEREFEFEELEPVEAMDNEERQDRTSVSKWSESWKILYHEVPKNKSQLSDWSKSWKLSHAPVQQKTYHDVDHKDQDMSEESFDIDFFETMPLLKAKKVPMILPSKNVLVSEWSQSWETTKPQSQPLSRFDLQHRPEKDESIKENSGISNEYPSKWEMSWKISDPGSWLQAEDLHHRNESIIPAKSSCKKFAFSQLDNDGPSLRLYSHSWKLLKPQTEKKTKSQKNNLKNPSDIHSFITSRKSKAKKALLSQLEKENPPPRKWGDAWRLAKSQPRQRRGSWLKMSKETINEDKPKPTDWSKSWKFFYTEQSEEKALMSEWEESWKYLLTHQQEREAERSK